MMLTIVGSAWTRRRIVLTKYLESLTTMLYGAAHDPVIRHGSGLLTMIALLACLLPRRNEGRSIVALRYE